MLPRGILFDASMFSGVGGAKFVGGSVLWVTKLSGTFVCPAGNTVGPIFANQLLPRGNGRGVPMLSGVDGNVQIKIRAEGEGRGGGGSGAY